MIQVILGNMWVCLVPSLPEPGVGLQLPGVGSTEWKAPESKIYSIRLSGVIKNGDEWSLEIWIGSGDEIFG